MGRLALRAAVLLLAVGLGLAAPLRGLRAPALLETSSGSGESPDDKYFQRDKLGLTVFDYGRLNIQRGSLDDPEDAQRAGGEAEDAEADQAEVAEAVEGSGSDAAEAADRVKQGSASATPPEVLRAVERRKALQRWLTFKKVKQTCPTFPFCNHIPPPPPMKPEPIALSHPMGLVHYPYVRQGQTPLPPEFDPKKRPGDGAAGGKKKKKGGLFGSIMSSVKGALVGSSKRTGEGKVEKDVTPGAAMYAGKVPRRWQAPFQKASDAPYDFEATMYNPPIGRIQAPEGKDLTREGFGQLPRSESADPDVRVRSPAVHPPATSVPFPHTHLPAVPRRVQTTASGDIPPAAPTLEEGREIRTPEHLQQVQWEMEGKKVEGTPFPEGHADAPQEEVEEADAAAAGGAESSGKKGTKKK